MEVKRDIMDVCLLAGKIMLESGAETYRVEDTMMRIARSFGIEESHSFVTPTGILFSFEIDDVISTKLTRISERTTDLQKVTMVNGISRRISNGELTVEEAFHRLHELQETSSPFTLPIKVAAASFSSGCFLIMFQGGWSDFIPAMLAGGAGYLSLEYIHRLVAIKFFSEFMAALIIGLVSYFFIWSTLGNELDKIIIGSVMPLVPGLLLTNAVRDLMAGHLISGLAKGAEAFLTALAIGSGIAVVLTLF